MKIWLVEDVYMEAQKIITQLQKRLGAEVKRFRTESDFREGLTRLRDEHVDLIMLDVMVPWSDPQPSPPPAPDDVVRESFHRAGLRCRKLIRQIDENIPIIIFTNLEQEDLKYETIDSKTVIVTKASDTIDDGLFRAIRTLIS